MANLTKFVYSGLKTGSAVDIYANRFPKIGHGKIEVLEPLRLRIGGKFKLPGFDENEGYIEIEMPNQDKEGICTVDMSGKVFNEVPYSESMKRGGRVLTLDIPNRKTDIYGGSKKWSWVDVSRVPASIGLWPAGDRPAVRKPAIETRPLL